MKRTTVLTLAVLAGWAMSAEAQTPERADPPQAAAEKRLESQGPGQVQTPGARSAGPRFVDTDGNGVCDNCTAPGAGRGRSGAQGRQGRGPGDGTGRQGVRARDGSGRSDGAAAGAGCRGGGRRGGGRGRGRR